MPCRSPDIWDMVPRDFQVKFLTSPIHLSKTWSLLQGLSSFETFNPIQRSLVREEKKKEGFSSDINREGWKLQSEKPSWDS